MRTVLNRDDDIFRRARMTGLTGRDSLGQAARPAPGIEAPYFFEPHGLMWTRIELARNRDVPGRR